MLHWGLLPSILHATEQVSSGAEHAAALRDDAAEHAIEAGEMVYIIFVEQVFGACGKCEIVT